MAERNKTNERLISLYLQAITNKVTFTMKDVRPKRGKRKAETPPPPTFIVGRSLSKQSRAIAQRSLFEQTEQPHGIINGLPKEVCKSSTFNRLIIALAKELYFQSVKEGGYFVTDPKGTPKELQGIGRNSVPNIEGVQAIDFPVIRKSIWDIGRSLWGNHPRRAQIEELYRCLGAIIKSVVEVKLANGKRWAGQLIWLQSLPVDNHFDEVKPWIIALNPIFGDLFKGYAKLPTDCLDRLNKVNHHCSVQHFILLMLLAEQRGNTYIRHFDRDFIEELLIENYDKDPNRKEQRLANVLDDLKAIGQILEYEVETRPVRGRQRWAKLTIHLNPAFTLKAGEA